MEKKQKQWNLIILSLLIFPVLVPVILKELNYRIGQAQCFGFWEGQEIRKIQLWTTPNSGTTRCRLFFQKELRRRGFYDDNRTEEEKLEDKLLGGTYYSPPPKKIDSETYSEMGSAGYLQRADNFFKNGDYSLALDDYREALSTHNNYMKISRAEIINKIGICFYNLENYKKARTYFTSAINHDSSKAQFFFNRGLATKKLGYENYAQEDFEKAKELAK